MSAPTPPEVAALLEHSSWMRSLARTLVTDPSSADDLVQETLVRALEKPPAHSTNLRGWLGRVVTNFHRQRQRARSRREDHEAAGARTGSDPSTLDLVERADTQRRLVEAVVGLAEPLRTTVLLRWFEGHSARAIARREGVTVSAVHLRLSKAYDELRSDLARDHDASGRSTLAALVPLAARTGDSLLAGALFMNAKIAAGVLLCVAATTALYVVSDDANDGPTAAPPGDEVAQAEAPSSELDVAEVEDGGTVRESAEPEGIDEPVAATAEPEVPEVSATHAVVEGVVVSPEGEPVKDAEVGNGAVIAFPSDVKPEPEETFRMVRTDENGRFRIEGIEPGPVDVTARAEGFTYSETSSFEMDAGETRTDVELVLRKGARLSGDVWGVDGELIGDRRVTLMLQGQRVRVDIKTDAFGRFEKSALLPGKWNVVAIPSQEELDAAGVKTDPLLNMTSTTVELEDGDDVFIKVGEPAANPVRVNGLVTLRGEPVRGLVQWFGEGGASIFERQKLAETDKDGRFALELDEPGPWLAAFNARSGRAEVLCDIPEEEEYELHIELPEGGISGRVLDPEGEPIAEVHVVLRVESGARPRSPINLTSDSTRTKEDGTFVYDVLEPGRYLVAIEGVAATDGEGALAGLCLRDVVVEEGERAEIGDVVLSPGFTISGRVVNERGQPAQHGVVFIHDENGQSVNPVSNSRTGEDGYYTSIPLAKGSYRVTPWVASEAGAPSEVIELDGDVEDLTLTIQPSRIVTVRAKDGTPLTVHLESLDGRVHSGLLDARRVWDWAADGFNAHTWRSGPLVPGSYRLRATREGGETIERDITVELGEGVLAIEL